MARQEYNYVINALSFLAMKISFYSSVHLFDINIHLENTFRDILNQIYSDRTFKNLNAENDNSDAIDLGDDKDDIAIQVTSTTKRTKVINTITKYKTDYNYKTVIMLYGVMDKPTREKDFEEVIDGRFTLIEWDLKDLNKKIINCDSNQLHNIQEIIKKDILPQIGSEQTLEDTTACEQWENVKSEDVRNFKDKIKAVNPTIREERINKYCRDIASGKVELAIHSDRYISAMKYRIFDVCQDELLEFCETRDNYNLTKDDIENLIEKYTNRAVEIIEDKSKDYIYPLKNKDILRKIVLALIDECYLSFDDIGIYNE